MRPEEVEERCRQAGAWQTRMEASNFQALGPGGSTTTQNRPLRDRHQRRATNTKSKSRLGRKSWDRRRDDRKILALF